MNDFLSILEQKKNAEELSSSDIGTWIQGVVSETIPNYQVAALLMAIRLNGMTFDETVALTTAMAESGTRLSFPGYAVVMDKHSTGGVGDKVTLILAPLIAACSLPVAMLSGRGLGFSGGTIDKLESLAGVDCTVGLSKLRLMLDEFGWANAMPSDTIVPADRILYGLRGVTATVDSIPLITASILSKKLAGGATHLCLDVKCGQGAFMKDYPAAIDLAHNLKKVGEMGGLKIGGVVSRMDAPLGAAVGNYLELLESIHYLQNPPDTRLMELVFSLGTKMLIMGKRVNRADEARRMMEDALSSGQALDRLLRYLRFCGAETKALRQLQEQTFDGFPRQPLRAHRDGTLRQINALPVAILCRDLGAGRKSQEDVLDPMAGLTLTRQVGDEVRRGDVLAWLYGDRAQCSRIPLEDVGPKIFTIGEPATSDTGIVQDVF